MVANRFLRLQVPALALLVCAWNLSAAAGEAETLKDLIVARVQAGARPTAFVTIFGQSQRAKVLAADAKTLTVQVQGNKMPLPWADLSADDVAQVAREAAESGAECLAVARAFLELKKYEQVEALCTKALSADAKLTEDAQAILRALPDRAPPPPPKPDAEVLTTAAKPAEGEASKPDLAKLAGIPSTAPSASGAARTNHEGRALPPLPKFDKPILFHTPEADAIAASMQIFPPNNAWNEDVSMCPVHPESAAMIANLAPGRGIFVDFSFSWVFVPPEQPKLPLTSLQYKSESDPGPYPIPETCPVEGWPEDYRTYSEETLKSYQLGTGGDRHALIVDPSSMTLYEFFVMTRTDAGWKAAGAAIFNLSSNKLRPDRWTSADAAGLPIWPGLIRYDEVSRGMVEHAIRVTFPRTRKEYVYPATHHAGATDDKTFPAMGQRLRLKAGVDLSGLPPQALAIALGLKKYGLLVADNGSPWFMSAARDARFDISGIKTLARIKGSDFEVVVPAGPHELGRGGAR